MFDYILFPEDAEKFKKKGGMRMDVVWVCGKCNCEEFNVLEINESGIHIECSECGEKPKLFKVIEIIGANQQE